MKSSSQLKTPQAPQALRLSLMIEAALQRQQAKQNQKRLLEYQKRKWQNEIGIKPRLQLWEASFKNPLPAQIWAMLCGCASALIAGLVIATALFFIKH